MNEKMKPAISIIIPIYQSERHLERLFQSIKKQTFENFEVLMINDGSTDNSVLLCEDICKSDKRFIIINQENKGVSSARNRGIEEACSDYICFIDSDDWIEKDYIKSLIEISDDYDMVVEGFIKDKPGSRTKVIPIEGEIRLNNINVDILRDLCEKYLLFPPWVKRYKKEILIINNIRFPENICYGEDLVFNFRYLDYVKRIKIISEASYHYIENEGSLSLKFRKNAFNTDYNQWRILKEFFKKNGIEGEMNKYLKERLFWLICDSITDCYRWKDMYSFKERFYTLKKILECSDLKTSDIDINDLKISRWFYDSIINSKFIYLWIIMEIKTFEFYEKQ